MKSLNIYNKKNKKTNNVYHTKHYINKKKNINKRYSTAIKNTDEDIFYVGIIIITIYLLKKKSPAIMCAVVVVKNEQKK